MDDKKENRKIKSVPKRDPEIGIDTKHTLIDDIIYATSTQSLDLGQIENLSSVAQSREQIYQTLDIMSQDSTLASVIETYAEDVVQTNDEGKIFWCESDDLDCNKLVSYYIEALNLDKNAYDYAVSLIKYGDLYLKTFKESAYSIDPLFGNVKNTNDLVNRKLQEDVKVNIDTKNDHYALYVEQITNPGEMFELTKFGKTYGYIQAPVNVQLVLSQQNASNAAYNVLNYKIKKDDITVYDAQDFVHAYLTNAVSRDPEKVKIFNIDEDGKEDCGYDYVVRRGSSILSDVFKIWRELTLLENSVLLNRLTKSSVLRLYQVEVGDMPKNKVQLTLAKIKELIEQKTAINTNKAINEYTNPGPMENSIIFPIHEGKGAIQQSTIGGDVDPKQLTDLDWFNNKLFGALRIPKQFFGITDDNAGFSGGQSLSIISSRYGKSVKRIQKALTECITDLINLLLIDRGQTRFVNKFKIRMQAPLTQEEIDRKADNDNKIRYVGDIMQQLSDIPDTSARLKILKSLLSRTISDQSVLETLEDQIKKLEVDEEENPKNTLDQSEKSIDDMEPIFNEEEKESEDIFNDTLSDIEQSTSSVEETEPEEQEAENEENIEEINSYIPTPAELGKDMTQNIK